MVDHHLKVVDHHVLHILNQDQDHLLNLKVHKDKEITLVVHPRVEEEVATLVGAAEVNKARAEEEVNITLVQGLTVPHKKIVIKLQPVDHPEKVDNMIKAVLVVAQNPLMEEEEEEEEGVVDQEDIIKGLKDNITNLALVEGAVDNTIRLEDFLSPVVVEAHPMDLHILDNAKYI
jgi:hypothetical protein